MDQTQLQQKIAEYYVKLPEELQVFFADQKWLTDIQNISTKYTLSQDQISTLITETTLVLLCIISIEDYISTIESDLKLPKENFDNMLDEIGGLIFKDTYEKLNEGFIKNLEILEEENKKSDKDQGVIKTTNETDVPLPPYSQTIKNNEENPITTRKSSVFGNKETIVEEKVVKEENKNIINEIKKDSSILEEKLKSATATNIKVSDYSVPKINSYPKTENNISKDPYHEPIE